MDLSLVQNSVVCPTVAAASSCGSDSSCAAAISSSCCRSAVPYDNTQVDFFDPEELFSLTDAWLNRGLSSQEDYKRLGRNHRPSDDPFSEDDFLSSIDFLLDNEPVITYDCCSTTCSSSSSSRRSTSSLRSMLGADGFDESSEYDTSSTESSSSLPELNFLRNSGFGESLIPTSVADFDLLDLGHPLPASGYLNSCWDSTDADSTLGLESNDTGGPRVDEDHAFPLQFSPVFPVETATTTSVTGCPDERMTGAPPATGQKVEEKTKRRPGRPKKVAPSSGSEDSAACDEETTSQRSRRRRKQHPWKGHHLWEFIRELLENNDQSSGGGGGSEGMEDRHHRPQLVRWENREKGVFLIINSKEVAELWGKRKKNSKMTYEKLSRSLRWCRTSGFLAEVPKDRKYPKKLCFCFGHRAYDINKTD